MWNRRKQKIIKRLTLCIILMAGLCPGKLDAQSNTDWYNNAQQRIDTLRKGEFNIRILDKNGEPFTGKVSVRMKKHEFPFGIAFDFYEGAASMGNTYRTESAMEGTTDKEIYRTERWNDYLAYAIPVESGKEYKLTLKFAEIYFDQGNSRLFDVTVEGELFLDDYDVYTDAGGKNKAIDKSLVILAKDNQLNIELKATKDNASIKGIVVEETGNNTILRINCGGPDLTTADGNHFISEAGYFDPDVNTVASREQWRQAAMYKYFNYGVSGNSFKWSGIQPQNTAPNYTNFENAVRWTQKVGWDLRAHTLLWGGNDAHSTPDWVRNLSTPREITEACKMRVIREVTRYKGIIKEYDVINEPLTGHADWLRKTVGDSIIWNSFKWARSADPDAELFINDYNVEYNWGQAAEYRDLILKVKEMGGPVTGVGMQAHFWDCCRPNIDELVRNVNIVAEAGLPIRFTECDWGTNLTQEEQASDFIKVLTIAFSHPSISGMICWGFDDAGAWRENTGFFDANRKPKLAVDTLLYYTQKKWATNFDAEINSGGSMKFDAYYGDYEIEVSFDEQVKVFNVPCLKENENSTFILHEQEGRLKGPQLLHAVLVNDNSVRLSFDKAINSSTLVRSNFKFFTNSGIGLNSVEIDPNDNYAVLLSLSAGVIEGDYVTVSYFPGSMTAVDGSNADAFGPEAVRKPENILATSGLPGNAAKLYPNPATGILNIEYGSGPYRVLLYNSIGEMVHSWDAQNGSLSVDVNRFKRGLYLVKLVKSDKAFTTKTILLK